jgi:hypothetical protein
MAPEKTARQAVGSVGVVYGYPPGGGCEYSGIPTAIAYSLAVQSIVHGEHWFSQGPA